MKHEHRYVGLFVLTMAALCLAGIAQAGTVTISANKTVADGKLVPVLTWTSSPAVDGSCTASGGWSGTKAGSGTETLAEITTSKAYTLTCSWPSMTGSATVNWTAPTTNTDGSPLTNLAGFLVVAGPSPDALSQTTNVNDPAARSTTITGLAGGTWHFGIVVVNSNGAQSAVSNIASKLVGALPSTASASVPITIRPVPMPAVLTTVIVAGVNYVPVFRLNAAGTDITHTPFGLIPVGRPCGAKVTTWRGKSINRVTVQSSEVWPAGSSVANLAAPCG